MNTHDYIASGILDEYIIGTVSKQEKQEVECMSHIYPEIKAELDSLSVTMEKYTRLHEIKPPEYLKEAIFAKLSFELEAKPIIEEKQNVRPMFSPMSIAAAALLAMACGFLFFQNQSQQQAIATLNQKATLVAMYQNTGIRTVALAGTEAQPKANATIFWDKTTAEVSINTLNLPKTSQDQQYQLWAIVAGKPVDLGVFDSEDTSSVQKMKATKTAEAFAVTIEKRGGSPSPTLTTMCLLGKV